MNDALVNKDESARILGFSPTQINRWCRAGLIQFSHLRSGRWSIRRSELERFARNNSIDLSDANHYPSHYRLAGLIKPARDLGIMHVTRPYLLRCVETGKLEAIRVRGCGSKKQTTYIGHAKAKAFLERESQGKR